MSKQRDKMAFPILPEFSLSRKPVPSFMRRPVDYFAVFISASKYWRNLAIETVGSGLGPFGLFPRPPLRPAQVKCSSQSLPIILLSAFWISPNFHHRCCSNLPADPLVNHMGQLSNGWQYNDASVFDMSACSVYEKQHQGWNKQVSYSVDWR